MSTQKRRVKSPRPHAPQKRQKGTRKPRKPRAAGNRVEDAAAATVATPQVHVNVNGQGHHQDNGQVKEKEPERGRLLAEIQEEAIAWYWPGFLPRNVLSAIAGLPSTGKSTLGAFLATLAKRPAFLPGCEEHEGSMLKPRLRAVGLAAEKCLILDRWYWMFPTHCQELGDYLLDHKVDFLFIDTLDDHLDVVDIRSPAEVRNVLLRLSKAGEFAGCTIVYGRHTSIDGTKVCPDNRAFRAVPREVLHLTYDLGPPERRLLCRYKDTWKQGRDPIAFTLCGGKGEPPVFQLGEVVDPREANPVMSRDELARKKSLQADEWLQDYLSAGQASWQEILRDGEKVHLTLDMLIGARHRLRCENERKGKGKEHVSYWWLPGLRHLAPTPGSSDSRHTNRKTQE